MQLFLPPLSGQFDKSRCRAAPPGAHLKYPTERRVERVSGEPREGRPSQCVDGKGTVGVGEEEDTDNGVGGGRMKQRARGEGRDASRSLSAACDRHRPATTGHNSSSD
ncbi:Hypothetical protein SMAX5B_019104 [Scophthalmus maximus]|uniref:Uncharacterized protein n=1 Tax=Scophthalmus maximus TaxID=52904 RepID=A0A2U9CCA2_SCOMX|nr:Hypothetical protein SMAX5B_019104 [Scophthalmus maximus]